MSTPAAPSSPSNPSANSAAGAAPAGQPTNSPGKPQGQPAADPNKKPAPAAAAEERKLKIKVDGKEVELPESKILELASAGHASTNRFQEAARLRRDAETVLKAADENPEEFLTKRGKDLRKWAEEFLMKELQKEAETPEQKKARENEEALRKYRDKEKADLDLKQREEMDRLTNEQRERYDKLFTEALFKSGLPRTKFTVKRMAELQKINLAKKLEVPADKLATLVREDYINEQKALLGGLEGDQLLEFLGPDIVKKFSKAQIAKLKARGKTPATKVNTTTEPVTEGMSWREYQKRNRRIV